MIVLFRLRMRSLEFCLLYGHNILPLCWFHVTYRIQAHLHRNQDSWNKWVDIGAEDSLALCWFPLSPGIHSIRTRKLEFQGSWYTKHIDRLLPYLQHCAPVRGFCYCYSDFYQISISIDQFLKRISLVDQDQIQLAVRRWQVANAILASIDDNSNIALSSSKTREWTNWLYIQESYRVWGCWSRLT